MKSPFTESNTSYLTNHPFGMVMPGRSWSAASAEGYRFGFNGKEGDGEIKGDGNSLDYGTRIYDSRIGRFLSIDKFEKKFAWLSPYVFAGNKPIMSVDIGGLGEQNATTDPPIKKNILIIIPASADEVKKVQPGPHGDWYVIVANDMVDAYKQFHTYSGTAQVNNMVIETHGTIPAGNLLVSNFASSDGAAMINNADVKDYRTKRAVDIKGGKSIDEVDGGNEQIDGIMMLSLGVKSGGNLVINSCRTGGDLEGKKMMQELAIIVNYRVNLYLAEGLNNGTVASNGSLNLNISLFDPTLSNVCDNGGNCYSNSEHPSDGFILMPAATTTAQIQELGSDGVHTGNITLQEKGDSNVIVNKKIGN